jgi:DeoR/GlpR family transcriptional regulator of sugar metabolism
MILLLPFGGDIILPEERRNWIEQQISRSSKIDIEEVAEALKVSAMTIRRDLAALEKEGKLVRIHGGAISVESLIPEATYTSKESKNTAEKREIASKALSLIVDNSTIILDSGTTTLELAKLLKDRQDLKIITNDIMIAHELLDSSASVIVTGGELQREVGALYGSAAQMFIEGIHVDICFLGVHAIDLEQGVTAPTFQKALIKQKMIASSERTYILADYSKFNKSAFSKVCDLSKIQGVVTDNHMQPSIIKEYSKKVKLL